MIKLIGGILLAFSLLYGLSQPSKAATYAEWGGAYSHPGAKKISDVKYVEFGKAGEHGKLAYSIGFGRWFDRTGYVDDYYMHGTTKARSSYYVHSIFGVEPKSQHFYMSYKIGPAFITHTDSLLGTNFQIVHGLELGMCDIRDVRLGFIVKHFSNAGIYKPNKGRDFVGVKIQW